MLNVAEILSYSALHHFTSSSQVTKAPQTPRGRPTGHACAFHLRARPSRLLLLGKRPKTVNSMWMMGPNWGRPQQQYAFRIRFRIGLPGSVRSGSGSGSVRFLFSICRYR